jgi:mRNA interferase HigB
MRVIGKVVLQEYAHADARKALIAWLAVAEAATWRNLVEVRQVYPHADYVKPHTVFNIQGNSYRLITIVNYREQLINIERCMTHAEYDKGDWK